MKEELLVSGRRFVSLMGQHHVRYRGTAFYADKGGYIQISVDSRIIVDVAYFRETNPNYVRPRINELARPNSSSISFYISDTDPNDVKSRGINPNALKEEDLIICSQTVYGWSFGNKQWRRSRQRYLATKPC